MAVRNLYNLQMVLVVEGCSFFVSKPYIETVRNLQNNASDNWSARFTGILGLASGRSSRKATQLRARDEDDDDLGTVGLGGTLIYSRTLVVYRGFVRTTQACTYTGIG